MAVTKKDIVTQLKKDILVLQGFRAVNAPTTLDDSLGPIAAAFPNETFPTGAMHEFLSTATEDAAATSGFVTGLLAALMQHGKVCLWISMSRTLFPPALTHFGVNPDQIIFIDLQCEKDLLWTMEEALKCEGLGAVVGEIRDLSFTASRRLQLAVEKSRVTGFLLRHRPRIVGTIAAVARWKIISLSSQLENNMPGVGFPRWNAILLKVRNGKPGSWEIEWSAGSFRPLYEPVPYIQKDQKRNAV